MRDQFERTFQLADLMCGLANRPFHVTLIEADSGRGRDVATIRMGWAGGIPQDPYGCFYGPAKAFELLYFASPQGTTLTPTAFEDGCGYQGGIRDDNLIVACSQWDQRGDLLVALTLMWSLDHEVRLHHVGFRHTSRASRDANITGQNALYYLPTNHERHYRRIVTDKSPAGVVFMEDQLWGEGSKIFGIHWDVATAEPEAMVAFVAQHLGIKDYEVWERKPNDPCAFVQVMDSDGVQVGLMARPVWTDVNDW